MYKIVKKKAKTTVKGGKSLSDNNRNPLDEEFKNSYTYKVAKELEKSVEIIGREVGRGVGNVINEVQKTVETNGSNYRKETTTHRTTYNGSGYNPNQNQRQYGYNFDPNTGEPINKNRTVNRNTPPKKKNKSESVPKWAFVVGALVILPMLSNIFWYSDIIPAVAATAIGVGAYHGAKAIKKWWIKRKEKKAHEEYLRDLEEASVRAEERAAAERAAKERVRKAEEEAAEAKKRADMAVKQTGDPELDKVIDEGNKYIIALREANDAIPGEDISNSIDRIEKACKGIFEYVREHPSKTGEIKKFMNYYLPTTLKLLKSYENLQNQTVKGENITSTMFDIEGMMVTIAGAFEKKLDQLFESDSLDISADIAVFENLLASEGLTDDGKNISITK